MRGYTADTDCPLCSGTGKPELYTCPCVTEVADIVIRHRASGATEHHQYTRWGCIARLWNPSGIRVAALRPDGRAMLAHIRIDAARSWLVHILEPERQAPVIVTGDYLDAEELALQAAGLTFPHK
ncbi:hypothetical protein [Longispora fulva]|uniref:Uncharacterized protein n=2 Tax=Longispora fulva TaxID=619741 RepID=A0A8J7H2H1_9ACTN|nr:hypothetical protein [Longispora fulva]MBG6140473.1 hypothetical protein [Longispora fulva]